MISNLSSQSERVWDSEQLSQAPTCLQTNWRVSWANHIGRGWVLEVWDALCQRSRVMIVDSLGLPVLFLSSSSKISVFPERDDSPIKSNCQRVFICTLIYRNTGSCKMRAYWERKWLQKCRPASALVGISSPWVVVVGLRYTWGKPQNLLSDKILSWQQENGS